MLMSKVFLLFCCVISANVFAGLSTNMGDFFNALGVQSNVTGAGSYENQSGGHLSGGSVFARAPVRNLQFVYVQLPERNIGCNGIDINMGGLSYINGQQFVETLKGIGTGAVSYAFMLGLQTVAPSIENLMSKLKTASQWSNQFGVNSCDAGAALLAGAALTNQTLSQKYCASSGLQAGKWSDWVAARHECKNNEAFAEAADAGSKNPQFKEIVSGDNFNVAWLAINKHPYLKQQSMELKQFYMSLSGTLIVKNRQPSSPASLLTSDLLGVIMQGGDGLTYKCDEPDKCLVILPKAKLKVEGIDSMVGKAGRLLRALAESIKRDVPLGDVSSDTQVSMNEAKAFLESTQLPVLRMLNVTIASTRGVAPLHIGEYSEVIALDVVYNYFDGILSDMIDAATQLKTVQFDKNTFETFVNNLEKVKKDIRAKRQDLYAKQQLHIKMIEEIRLLEQQLASNIDVGKYLN